MILINQVKKQMPVKQRRKQKATIRRKYQWYVRIDMYNYMLHSGHLQKDPSKRTCCYYSRTIQSILYQHWKKENMKTCKFQGSSKIPCFLLQKNSSLNVALENGRIINGLAVFVIWGRLTLCRFRWLPLLNYWRIQDPSSQPDLRYPWRNLFGRQNKPLVRCSRSACASLSSWHLHK